MSQTTQSFESHAKFVPAYHYVTTPLLMFPTLYFGYGAVRDFSVGNLAMFLFGVGVVMAAFFARLFPLGVQDRVIRLEEQKRMDRLFTDDLKARIGEVTTEQMNGLRYASDEELADLVRRVLDENISDRKTIKQDVKNWRADNERI